MTDSEGGEKQDCGWLKDRFGVSWQIVPVFLADMMNDPDRKRAEGVMLELLQMKKSIWRLYKTPITNIICSACCAPN